MVIAGDETGLLYTRWQNDVYLNQVGPSACAWTTPGLRDGAIPGRFRVGWTKSTGDVTTLSSTALSRPRNTALRTVGLQSRTPEARDTVLYCSACQIGRMKRKPDGQNH
jgi:hypothetical protein